jgi:hypothetical protein
MIYFARIVKFWYYFKKDDGCGYTKTQHVWNRLHDWCRQMLLAPKIIGKLKM